MNPHPLALVLSAAAIAACGETSRPMPDAAPAADLPRQDAETPSDPLDASPDAPDEATAPPDTSAAGDSATTDDGAAPETSAPTVSWCVLQHPPALAAGPGAEAGVVFGRVFVDGVTNAPRDGATVPAGLEGALGWAPIGEGDAAPADDAWTWTPGVNARAVDANHEFEATLTAPRAEGRYRYAWRFRATPEGLWTRCDLDGTDTGFDPQQAGLLTVTAPRPAWCRVQYPTDAILMTAGETTERLYGRVFAEGLTGDGRRGAVTDLMSEAGYGPRGSVPDAGWTWVAGAFNVVVDNGLDGARTNDEHVATLTVPNPGTYAWTWRFRVAPDGPWLTCDLNGVAPADAAALPPLTVVNAPP